MRQIHRDYMCSTESIDPNRVGMLVGASMGFSAHVLNRVPSFDPELGPGALGFCDDTLFSRQLLSAGFRLIGAFDYPVVHRFDADRLSRANFLERARCEGRSQAYIAFHWDHYVIRTPRKELFLHFLRFTRERAKRRSEWRHEEGIPDWEFLAVGRLHFLLGYLRERRRPRNYTKHGLVKLVDPIRSR